MTSRWRWISLLVALPLMVLVLIAASEGLFLRTVPLEQRLLSRNETIRKKAQQGLLGESPEQKQETVRRLIPALIQPDPFKRKWAAISLALIGTAAQEAIPALLQDVSDKEKEVAQAARVALGEIGAPDPSQLPTLMQALGNNSEAVQCEAVASIAKLGPSAQDAVPLLLAAVKREAPLPECYVTALSSLNDFLPQVEISLTALLPSTSAVTREHAATVLARMPVKNTPTIEMLFKTLANEQETDVQHALSAALTLRRAPAQGMVAVLAAGVQYATDATIRYNAFILLKNAAPAWEALKPALQHALRDHDEEVRRAALEWVLEKPEWTRALAPTLFDLLSDEVPAQRRLALAALYNVPWHGKEHVQEIALMQRDKDAEVRCLAVRQLVEMDHADRISVARLTTDLKKEPDPACAVEALALAGYFNGDVVPAMIHVLEEKEWRAQSRAATVLLHLGARAKPALGALVRAQHAEIPGAENALFHIRLAIAREKRRRS